MFFGMALSYLIVLVSFMFNAIHLSRMQQLNIMLFITSIANKFALTGLECCNLKTV